MKRLALPCTDAVDDQVLTTLCKNLPWTPHQENWLSAYANYRTAGSNPWAVMPQAFNPDIAVEQRQLYENRKGNGPIRRIRYTPGLICCPLCGSPTTNSVDHLLPRADYPEFSIMRANLVPACVHCNSASKGNKHRGDADPERFIHPYFDQFADDPLWYVRVNPNFDAPTFDACPMGNLVDPALSIVRYHLKHVLGDVFRTSMATFWSTYPKEVKIDAQGQPVTIALTAAMIDHHLLVRTVTRGLNGWETAALRGFRANPAAIESISQRAVDYILA